MNTKLNINSRKVKETISIVLRKKINKYLDGTPKEIYDHLTQTHKYVHMDPWTFKHNKYNYNK